MNKKILNILKIIAFLLLGAFLFWLVYRQQDIDKIKSSLLKAKYEWILLSVFLGLLSHISRAIRWKLLLDPLGYKTRGKSLFYSVMIMYLANHAIPRSGEIIRCGVVNRYEKIPFSTLLGTVFIERVIDFIMLFILTLIVIITQFSVIFNFVDTNFQKNEALGSLTNLLWIVISIFVFLFFLLLLLYFFRKKIKKTKFYEKIKKLITDFISGIKSIMQLEQKWHFLAHSVFIWVLYFIMIYVAFKAFDFTSDLSLLTGLTIFVISAFGMVFPSPGGIGSWHFVVIQALLIFGINKTDGSAFAFAAHESQMIMLISVGLISLIATSFLKINNSKKTNKKL